MLPIWSMGSTIVLLGAASYTDIRWRRIPNVLTFPAIALGLVLHLITGGWEGLLLSISGTLLAPCVLHLMHGGKGLGMGDIKLAAALGALLGPSLGTLAMLLSMVSGGFLAIAWILKEWGFFGQLTSFKNQPPKPIDSRGQDEKALKDVTKMTIPYGVAIALGTLLTLVVCLWTGKESWYFWFVTSAASPL